MRVLHVTYQHPADDARILHKQCRTIAEAGIETHLVAPAPVPPTTFSVHLHPLNASPGMRRLQQVRVWFRDIVALVMQIQPDIVHVHDPLLLSIRRRLQRTGARLVYDAHEDHSRQIRALTHLSWPRRQIQAAYYGRLGRDAARHADLIVAATPGIARQYPARRTVTVRNLPRLDEFTPPTKQALTNAVIYIGGLTRSRGIIEMIDAIERVAHSDARLILAGRFDSEQTRRAAHARPGWARVDHRGWVDHAQIPLLLHDALAGLVVLHPMPNYIDAWPVKLFEYMAAGLPFVASDFTPWRAMLHDESCGLFIDPKNPRAIAGAVDRLLHDRDRAAEFGRIGRSLVEREFNWEREAEVLLHAYERLLARS